jgi:hypothetical protein
LLLSVEEFRYTTGRKNIMPQIFVNGRYLCGQSLQVEFAEFA